MKKILPLLMALAMLSVFIMLGSSGYAINFPDSDSLRNFIDLQGDEGDLSFGGLFTAYFLFENIFGDDGVLILNTLFTLFSIFLLYKYEKLSYSSIVIILSSVILVNQPNRENLFIAGAIGLYIGVYSSASRLIKIILICFSVFIMILAKVLLALIFSGAIFIFFFSKKMNIKYHWLIFLTLIISLLVINTNIYTSQKLAYLGNNDISIITSNISDPGFIFVALRFIANCFSPIIHIFSQENILLSYHLYIGIASLVFLCSILRIFFCRLTININQELAIYIIFVVSTFVPFVQTRYCVPAMLLFFIPPFRDFITDKLENYEYPRKT